MAGVTTRDVNDDDSISTIHASVDAGATFIDTAYVYGPRGESERLIRRAIEQRPGLRGQVVIATKGGIHYDANGKQAQDARPDALRRECDESLQRLGIDQVELYYLHAPDKQTPVAESAGAIAELIAAGKAIAAGASNCSLEEIQEFHSVCPLAAVQLPYNMLQRDIEQETIPWCIENQVAVTAYWPLMKGLLAGGINDQTMSEQDSRRSYPQYQGDEFAKNQQFVAELRQIADEVGKTVAQVVVNWTIHQPGITAALCGAKRAWQIEETAGAMGWQLNAEQLAAIERAIAARGKAAAKRLFQ
jgi:aryl-alcohol dehydrogenase-like predicted oxidoreductase